MKATCSFVNGRYSNWLDGILLGWLPINERIDFCIIKLAHKALHVASFPSYQKLSFKKLSRNLRNKDAFLINNFDKNSNTFIGKARIFFNNLPYPIRSISSFKMFSREVKKYLLDQAQAKYFQRHSWTVLTLSATQTSIFYSSCFTSNLENCVSFFIVY